MSKRIVVTGYGVVSPVGIGADNSWNALINGQSGAEPITKFDVSAYKTRFACEVKGFDPLDFIERKDAKRMDRYCQFAVASAKEAIETSGLDSADVDRERIGVIVGSGIGGMETFEQQVNKAYGQGPGRVSPFFIPMMIGDIAAGHVSIRWGFKGPNYAVQSACATATHAIGVGVMHLRAGDVDAMVVGGSEAPITVMGLSGFSQMNALSTRNDDPKGASRPFDGERDGFVIGEGGATFVIETEEHARKRGAEILGELIGHGFSGDAYHLTAPVPGGYGAQRSMKSALKMAGIQPEDVGYINAHGTSTPFNDDIETTAIKAVFGDHAYKLAVSSTKSMSGHLLGAAGGFELFVALRALQTGVLPPTINNYNADPNCDLFYVPNQAIERDIDIAISNTFGFGGHNATIAAKAWRED